MQVLPANFKGDIVEAIHVVFSILVVAILGFSIAGHAATATISYTYDDLNCLTAIGYRGGVTQTFAPDEAVNNLIECSDDRFGGRQIKAGGRASKREKKAGGL